MRDPTAVHPPTSESFSYMRPSSEGRCEWLLAVALLPCVVACTSSLAKGAASNSELGSGWRRDPTAPGLSLGNKLGRYRQGCDSSSSQQSPCLGAVGPELRGGSESSTKGTNAIPGIAMPQLPVVRVSIVVHDHAISSNPVH